MTVIILGSYGYVCASLETFNSGDLARLLSDLIKQAYLIAPSNNILDISPTCGVLSDRVTRLFALMGLPVSESTASVFIVLAITTVDTMKRQRGMTD